MLVQLVSIQVLNLLFFNFSGFVKIQIYELILFISLYSDNMGIPIMNYKVELTSELTSKSDTGCVNFISELLGVTAKESTPIST